MYLVKIRYTIFTLVITAIQLVLNLKFSRTGQRSCFGHNGLIKPRFPRTGLAPPQSRFSVLRFMSFVGVELKISYRFCHASLWPHFCFDPRRYFYQIYNLEEVRSLNV